MRSVALWADESGRRLCVPSTSTNTVLRSRMLDENDKTDTDHNGVSDRTTESNLPSIILGLAPWATDGAGALYAEDWIRWWGRCGTSFGR